MTKVKVFLVVFLPLVTYLNILNNELLLDDPDHIVNNAYIRDWRYLSKSFTENSIAGAGKTSDYYRPAIQVAFTLGYSLWKLNPVGYHFLSILFHTTCAILLYLFLLKINCNSWSSLLVTLLFAVHPVQSEAVDSASALGILMGMFFMLLTLIGYCHCRDLFSKSPTDTKAFSKKKQLNHYYGTNKPSNRLVFLLTLLTTVCALLSKETMVIIPGTIFLAEFYFYSVEKNFWNRLGKSLVRSLPYLAIVAIYIILRFTILNFGGTGNLYRTENIFTQSWLVRFYTFCVVLVEFIKIILWPQNLYMERATVIPIFTSLYHPPVLLGAMLLFGLIMTAFFCTRSFMDQQSSSTTSEKGARWTMGVISFGILWFLFGLVPVSNIFIPISTIMVESWLYTPIVGILLIFSSLIYTFAKNKHHFIIPFLTFILLACALRTFRQNEVWKNPIAFYEHTLRHAPGSARFRNNLAMAYADKKRYNDSIQQYQLAIQTNDEYPETHHNLGNSYLAVGKAREAEIEFQKAVQMNPQFFHSYLALASLYFNYNRLDLAQHILENLILNAPSRWEGYYNLGILAFRKGDKERAISLWRKGLDVDPYNKVLKEAIKTQGGQTQ